MSKRFRPNVCAVLTDAAQARVLVFHRADQAFDETSWQFPQGGLQPGEAPEAGLLRELAEEIGTQQVTVLQRLPEPVRYEYPPDVLARLQASGEPDKAGYHGQEQHWFLARLDAATDALRFDTHGAPEFDACAWVTPGEAVSHVVPFKRPAYRRALQAFGLLADDGAETGTST